MWWWSMCLKYDGVLYWWRADTALIKLRFICNRIEWLLVCIYRNKLVYSLLPLLSLCGMDTVYLVIFFLFPLSWIMSWPEILVWITGSQKPEREGHVSFNNLQMQLVTGVRYESTPKSIQKGFWTLKCAKLKWQTSGTGQNSNCSRQPNLSNQNWVSRSLGSLLVGEYIRVRVVSFSQESNPMKGGKSPT